MALRRGLSRATSRGLSRATSRGLSRATSRGLSRATSRGFTLLELLVVIVVLLALMGLLLPAISKARKTSQVIAMKQNFHTIMSGLENYKSDFRDYPKNGFATTDIYSSATTGGDAYRSGPPRNDPSLAMAMLGPGPANGVEGVLGTNGIINADMDGADGPGFRTVMSPVTTYGSLSVASATAGSKSITVTGGSGLPTFSQSNITTSPPTFTMISLGGPGSPDAHVPVTVCSGANITLAVPLQQSYTNAPVGLLYPTGRTWGPYIPTDQFKVGYIVSNVAVSGSTVVNVNVPVLLDIWGGPILYFPAYNSYVNQAYDPNSRVIRGYTSLVPFPPIGTSSSAVTPSAPSTPPVASIGPLFGMPLLTQSAHNTSVDSANSFTGPSIFWSGPLGSFGLGNAAASFTAGSNAAFDSGQVAAILVKLGDQNANNVIENGENFAVQLPYFLMSPGPDGHFEDLSNAAQSDWNRIMTKSDDVYNFDQ